MQKNKLQIISTLGPATHNKADIEMMKARGVDFVRINMSHSSIEDLSYFIKIAKEVDIPFILDTEGPQVRTGNLKTREIAFVEQETVHFYDEDRVGDKNGITLRPAGIIHQLEVGDILYVDFGTLALKIIDTNEKESGYITAEVLADGKVGNNKAVVVDPATPRKLKLDTLTGKDLSSIKIGLQEGVGYIAASYMRDGNDVVNVRNATKEKMKIISKVECQDALDHLDDIIDLSDAILLDRGDLSKEVLIERIPFLQKIVIQKTKMALKGMYVATNFLESMVENKKPTRAEINDTLSTIYDGASGLALSAETAIGKYPMEAVNMMKRVMDHATFVQKKYLISEKNDDAIAHLEQSNYKDIEFYSNLIEPHGGKLINRFIKEIPSETYIHSLVKIRLNENLLMDVEQIGIGTFSPIEGFMNQKDFFAVLETMRMDSGVVWTIPIILDVDEAFAKKLSIGQEVALTDDNDVVALMRIDDIYTFDKKSVAEKLFGTIDEKHPGVKNLFALKSVLLGGKIDLLKRRSSPMKQYEFTPRQTRRIFLERGWSKVVGFHTRNVIHRSHEFIQLEALKRENCDGLFVHPIIGKKKVGDYEAEFIIQGYEEMVRNHYPKGKVVLSAFATFSRYAGPREAIFTALCRKNFGCSHFIVGRDHTGVGDFYHPLASHEIFDRFSDLGITPVRFGKVFFSDIHKKYVHENDDLKHSDSGRLHISGTDARKMFEKRKTPPEWFMRKEISKKIIQAIKKGRKVFVEDKKEGKVVWFTGLSGSGKTTIAEKLKEHLATMGKKVEIIDGDTIRNTVHRHLGFSREDIALNNKLIAQKAKEVLSDFDYILIPIISPHDRDRKDAKNTIGKNFYLLYINCPPDVCQKRDPKGLYKKAAAKEITNLIGFSDSNPYEVPQKPDIEIHTDANSLDECVESILRYFSEV